MVIRHAEQTDIPQIAQVEAAAFPPAEAASPDSVAQRVETFPQCFWLWEEEGQILAFINGMATNRRDLADEMYHDASLHDPDGEWLMIFSVATHPDFRHQGRASALMERVISDSRGVRKGLVLTCKEHMLGFYARFGFVSEGISDSDHGGARWYQMRLAL